MVLKSIHIKDEKDAYSIIAKKYDDKVIRRKHIMGINYICNDKSVGIFNQKKKILLYIEDD